MTTTATINIAGVEQTVEIDPYEGRAWVAGVAAVVGRGVKKYPTSLTLWEVTDQRPHLRGNDLVVDSAGNRWQFHLTTCVRNRQARIVGWAAAVGIDNEVDQTRRTPAPVTLRDSARAAARRTVKAPPPPPPAPRTYGRQEFTMTDLRTVAKLRGIRGYTRMDGDTLLAEIVKVAPQFA
jgi:hypothetical protein